MSKNSVLKELDSKSNLTDNLIDNSSLNTTDSAHNIGFIFDEHLTFSDQILAISKACYYHIRQFCCKLLNPQQSAYCKHHSTETALLYTHDHLINAI